MSTKSFVSINHRMIFHNSKTQLSCFGLNAWIKFYPAK